MANHRLDPIFVRAQIDALRVSYPDIADDEDQWLLTLESETDLREFLTLAVRRMRASEGLAAAAAAEVEELAAPAKARQQRFERRSEAMRSLMFRLMSQAELRKLELPLATLSIRAGPQKVIITDETKLPTHCIRIRKEPDKIAIKAALDSGQPVPGAEMSNAEPVLSVRKT